MNSNSGFVEIRKHNKEIKKKLVWKFVQERNGFSGLQSHRTSCLLKTIFDKFRARQAFKNLQET